MKYSITLLAVFWAALSIGQSTIGEFITTAATTTHLETIAANFDLTETLQNEQNLTVFAPNDDAVEAYANSLGMDISAFLSSDEALQMIQYHVVLDQQIIFSEIADELEFETALGTTMLASVSNGTNSANETSVSTADFVLDNGIVQLLDAVILPSMSIYDWIDGSSNHNYIKIAIDNTNMAEMFQAIDAMTFFAPTDQSFIDFADANDITIYDILYSPDLSAILMDHLLGEAMMYAADLIENGSAVASSGTDLYVLLGADGAASVNDASILSTDIMTHNGLVHSIEGIIEPLVLLSDILQAQGLTLLDTLMTASGLNPAINFDGAEYTMFAPTDSAILDFMEETNATLEDLLNPDGLAEALLYHTTAGIAYASDLTDGMQITMNSSPDEYTTVSFAGDSIFINESMVVAADITVFQGLIHIIDRVLIQPESGCMDEAACNFNDDAVIDDGSCYSLEAYLTVEDNPCANGADGMIAVDSVLYAQTDGLEFMLFDAEGEVLGNNEFGTFEGLAVGMYFVEIMDGEECTQLLMAEVMDPNVDPLEFEASSSQNEDGSIIGTTTIAGGLAPFDVVWQDESTGEVADALNLVNGTYIVTVTDANGCSVSLEIDIEYTSSIGGIDAQTFRVYPNPTQGVFRLETTQNGPLQLNISGVNGAKILEWSGITSNLSTFDLSGFPNGFYTLQIIHQQSITQQLLLKND